MEKTVGKGRGYFYQTREKERDLLFLVKGRKERFGAGKRFSEKEGKGGGLWYLAGDWKGRVKKWTQTRTQMSKTPGGGRKHNPE